MEQTGNNKENEQTQSLEENNGENTIRLQVDESEEAESNLNPADYNTMEQTDLINRLKELIKKDALSDIKSEVDVIKVAFYKKHRLDIEKQKQDFTEQGGNATDFIPKTDDSETIFKEILNEYKKHKAQQKEKEEKELAENLQRKLAIIDQLKELIDSTADISETLPAFRALVQDWKSVGQVPPANANEMWKNYNILQEKFYDLIKINNELREYDFKKNLELKTGLCEQAESLDKEDNVISAFQQLQKLHEDWKNVGPVEREQRELIWNRFKEASSTINKKHQQYFEKLKAQEEENLKQKTAICEILEAIDFSLLKTFKQWEEQNEAVLKMQEQWKTVGFAPRKENVKIYERFRNACNRFFKQKSQFYKDIKEEFNENLKKKEEICALAESLKESTNWGETAKKMADLQKEWKGIGQVPKKSSDAVWKRFVTACDYFFEQRNKIFADKKLEEEGNLAAKKVLIDKIKNLELVEDRNENLAKLKDFAVEWNKIGHIPFKSKDKVFADFKAALDKHYDVLHVDAQNRRLDTFVHAMSDKKGGDLNNERRKLLRQYDVLQSDIKTYENNMGFFSSSKTADKLLAEMQRKIEKLRSEAEIIAKKIEIIDQKS